MINEALYVEERCKIPVWDSDLGLWIVNFRSGHTWVHSCYENLPEATNFYNEVRMNLHTRYRETHKESLKLPVDLSLLTKGEIVR